MQLTAAAARHDRETAEQLERVGRHQDGTAGPGAGADERDLASSLRESAETLDTHAAAALDRAVASGQPNGQPAYARACVSELAAVPQAAAQARLDAAAGFPLSTHEAMASKHAPKARVVRGAGAASTRDNDRTR